MSLFALTPALPLHAAGKYVAGAYIAFAVMLIVYLGIMAIRLGRTQRELNELKAEIEASEDEAPDRDLEHVG
jgi:hypothetical protein